MDKILKVSELPEIEQLNNQDILLVSKQEEYNRKSSKSIKYSGIVQSLRKSFEQELYDLAYINDNFVDDSTLTFSYNSSTKKIILKTDAHTREIDAKDFIYDGMIDNVTYDKSTHIITITFNTKSGKTPIVIDISDLIDVYSAGHGLSCSNKVFSIDTTVVSEVGHTHSDYAKKTDIDGVVYEKGLNLKYNKITNTLSLSAGSTVLTTEISAGGGGGGGVTYEEVHSELSNDGYAIKVRFRDWS